MKQSKLKILRRIFSGYIGRFSEGKALPAALRLANTFLVSLLLFSFAGCAPMRPEDNQDWYQSQKPILMARSQARWQALIQGDIASAYAFTSPDYRAVVNLQQYKGKYGKAVNWLMAKPEAVHYDEPTVATVSVEVRYRVELPGMAGKPFESQRDISEKWIYKDQGWWYTTHGHAEG